MSVTVERNTKGKGWVLRADCVVPRPLDEVFEFFSDAYQLERLTPDFLRFQVLTPAPIEMKPGITIDYKLRVRGLPLRWRSKISVWEPQHRFVDEMLKGPYSWWHHEHTFESVEGGTKVADIVHYGVPGGPIINALFVQPDVKKIFAYRQQVLNEIFADQPETVGV